MRISKLMVRTAGLAVAGIIGTVTAHPAVAQGGVNIVPWAGVYVPTRNDVSTVTSDIFKRDVSVIGGARLEFWGTGRLGFEAVGGYAPAKISGETINETNTNLLAASGRLLLAISPPTNKLGVFIGAGPALISRGQNPFDNDKSSTDFGGTAGLGFRFGSGEKSRIGVRLDFEDYMYNGDFGGGDKKFQNDLVGSLGLTISLGGSPD